MGFASRPITIVSHDDEGKLIMMDNSLIMGFSEGSMEHLGIAAGEETCKASLELFAAGNGISNYAACTHFAPESAAVLVDYGVTFEPLPGRAQMFNYNCEAYCASLGVPTSSMEPPGPMLESLDLTALGFTEIKGDGVTAQCDVCSDGSPFPEGSKMCCSFSDPYVEGADYIKVEAFDEGAGGYVKCAEHCLSTAGCTGIELVGTPNFCYLWMNDKCSSLDADKATANSKTCRTYHLSHASSA